MPSAPREKEHVDVRKGRRQGCLRGIFVNALPVEALDPRDVSNAVLWLASEEARYVTGAAPTVDAGNTIR
jgi:NAD(P)-dependent dehydrogenase (short-subunit alcohol dehydrogenase family)